MTNDEQAAFEQAGGRGVDLAERIDALRQSLNATAETNASPATTRRVLVVVTVPVEILDSSSFAVEALRTDLPEYLACAIKESEEFDAEYREDHPDEPLPAYRIVTSDLTVQSVGEK